MKYYYQHKAGSMSQVVNISVPALDYTLLNHAHSD